MVDLNTNVYMDSSALMEISIGHCRIDWLRRGNTVATIAERTAKMRMQAAISHFQCSRGKVKALREDAVDNLESSPGSVAGHSIGIGLFSDNVVAKGPVMEELNAGAMYKISMLLMKTTCFL